MEINETINNTGPGASRLGIVHFFNQEKGYGQVKDNATQENFFMHSGCLRETVKENDRVSFDVEGNMGGLIAVNVRKIVPAASLN